MEDCLYQLVGVIKTAGRSVLPFLDISNYRHYLDMKRTDSSHATLSIILDSSGHLVSFIIKIGRQYYYDC